MGWDEIRKKGMGKWAVLDIETTGIHPLDNDIVDVGFLEFEDLKLKRVYSSLVHSNQQLSQFIQKLTGINQQMIQKAPGWSEVSHEIASLHGFDIWAHNSDFEKSFLESTFRPLDTHGPKEQFCDSLYLLSLLAPWKSSLGLERFIVDWGIAAAETHRGLSDSEDLLKVLLVGIRLLKSDSFRDESLYSYIDQHKLSKHPFVKFLSLSLDDLQEIAVQLDSFDFDKSFELAQGEFYQFQGHSDLSFKRSSRQTAFSKEFSGENIKSIFRDHEAMKERFQEYQYRESQETLAMRTGQALKNGVHALVQAPTGTGKTLGYLLPSALHALNSDEQVLIATGTKTLQEQAFSKDVPSLYEILDLTQEEFPIATLVGSKNHLCEMLFRQAQESLFDNDLFDNSDDESFDNRFTFLFLDWIFFHNAHLGGNILIDDLPYIFSRKLKAFKSLQDQIRVDFRSCTGHKCPFKNECTYMEGLKKAKEAKIIIGNHSLMFQWPRSFPRPSSIIVDEAHKIESEVTSSCTLSVSSSDLTSLNKNLTHLQGLGSLFYLLSQTERHEGESTETINILRQSAQQTQVMINDHFHPLEALLESFFKKRPRYTDAYWNEAPMIQKNASSQDLNSRSIFNHIESLKNIVRDLLDRLVGYLSRWEVKSFDDEKMVIAYGRFETFVSMLDDIYRTFEILIDSPEDFACSMSYHEQHGFLLQCAPIDVGRLLHDNLLENAHAVVFTSATLGNASGDKGVRGIEWATGYTYLESTKRFQKGFFLPAVYDYERHTKVFLCHDVPSLHDDRFVPFVLDKISPLIEKMGGRCLLLFSAKKRFEHAREILLSRFEGKIPLFIQGMGNQVIESFKSSKNGILLGMESFSEGIDIPGRTLQFVYVDKVPDLRMDYVIQKRRDFFQAEFGNEFVDYYLAHRARSLHQKLGRLIRTETDYGGIIITDSRISRWKGDTLKKFLYLMKPYEMKISNLENASSEIEKFVITENQIPEVFESQSSSHQSL